MAAKVKPPKKTNNGGGDDPDPEPGDDTGGGDLGGGGGDLGGGGGDLGGGDLGSAPPLDGAPPVDAPPAGETPGETPAQAGGSESPGQLTAVAAGPLPWYSGIGRTGLLLVPALMIAYLVMVAMGPSAQPVVGGDRRGVSRALDRLAQGGVTRLGRKS